MEQAVRRKYKSSHSKSVQKKEVVNGDISSKVLDKNGKNEERNQSNNTAELSEEGDAIKNVTNLGNDLEVTNSNYATHSSVVPGHFYKICSTKSDQTILEQDLESYDQSRQLPFICPPEPSAPDENYSLDSALSPTAPALTDTPLNSGDFSLDPNLEKIEDMINDDQEGNVLLPLQDDDWELGASETNQERIYPKLAEEEPPPILEPFTKEQLSMFYHNVLLDHIDSYVDQFLADTNDHDEQFKILLTTYYEARQQLIKQKQKHKKYQDVVQKTTKSVFITNVGKVEVEGICQDQRKVNTVHQYDVCEFDSAACSRLSLILREDRRIASEDVCLACYSSTVARLHCEQFLFEATEKYNRHRKGFQENTAENLSSSAVRSSILLQLIDESVRELKAVANVLFLFARKRKCKDDEYDRFWKDLEKWITLIILHLVQSSNCTVTPGRHFREEMFVLNHMLRCPPGLHEWGGGLMQISGPLFARDGNKDPTALDHCICLLYLILKPPKGRNDFLAELTTINPINLAQDKTDGWTVIDDDGDEIDSSSCDLALMPLEGDLITVFRQLPLEHLLSSILQLYQSPENTYYYSNIPINSEDIMTTFASCDLICDILGEGLATFGRPRYKQLVRRVAQAMRNVILIVSKHWQHYKLIAEKNSTHQLYSNQRLQLEFDEFYKRCVSRLLAVAKLGIYQFVADLSYHHVSQRAAETLYLLMNVPPGVRSEVDTLISEGYSQQEWLDFIRDPDTKLAFEDHLSNMPANEIVYLLTTFANLAQARPSSERHLVNTIAVDIFKVSFVYKSTRDICSKTGRELLSSVAQYHPYIISTLLQFVRDNMDTVLPVAIYALSDLPFALWQPTDDDVTIFRSWILSSAVGSPQCKLSQIVIQNLNLKLSIDDILVIPVSIHQQLAILLVEACVRVDNQQGGLMMKSIDHMTKVASAVRLASHPNHQQFVAWCWKILFRLKLHQPKLQLKQNSTKKEIKKASALPDINVDSKYLPVLHSAKDNYPIGCYVAVISGNAGHRMEAFLQDGLEFIYVLAVSKKIRALLHIFDSAMPMFYGSNVNLGLNSRFGEVLSRFLHATDEGIISGVTSYMLSDEKSQKSALSLLTSVVANHIKNAAEENDRALILSYWLQVVLAIANWYKDNHLRTFVDYIFESSLLVGDKCLLDCRAQLYDNFVNMMLHGHNESAHKQQKNMMTSIIQMVAGNNYESLSYIHSITSSENIYFKFETLSAETRYENDCGLWSTLLVALRSDPKLSVESAVKKASAKLKLSHHPIHTHLAVYRWAELALHVPHDQPLLPVIWYNFFLRFIYLPKDGGNSLGCRFFDAVNVLPLFNKMRMRLQGSMEFHHGVVSSKSAVFDTARQHELLVKLYQCFKLWLEEPKMHEYNLYLPSLPAQYNSKLLALVRTKNVKACDDLVDKPSIKREIEALSDKWIQLNSDKPIRRLHARQSYHQLKIAGDSQDRINHLLKQFECPLPIPPDVVAVGWAPPVAIGNVSSLYQYDTVLAEIDQDLKVLSAFADQFTRSELKQHDINNQFLSLIPHLYYMKAKELTVYIECQSAFSSTHKCSGAAELDLRFKEMTLDESVAHKIQANRNVYKLEMEDFMNENVSEELSYTLLHLESIVRALEVNFKNPTYNDELHKEASDAGIRLFYLLADMYSGERAKCLPTKKLISVVVELLGQRFVAQSSDEASHILQQVINNPESAPLLSSHFAPGCKSRRPPEDDVKDYLKMYQKVVRLVSTTKNDNPDVLFVLLTKFDMASWLTNFNPRLKNRIDLLHNTMIGMVSCYEKFKKKTQSITSSNEQHHSVVTHKLTHTSVHEVYLNHFRALLGHNYPDMLIEALRYLLEASRTKDIGISTWQALLDVSFPDLFLSATDQTKSYYYSAAMNFNMLEQIIELLHLYFNESRNSIHETGTSSLYVTWKPYAQVFSQLFKCIGNTYLHFVVTGQLPLLYTETKLTSDQQWCSINSIYDLFSPWLQPFYVGMDLKKDLAWPWREDEIDIAKNFTDTFSYLLREFCYRDNLPTSAYLSQIWSSYAATVIQEITQVPKYIYEVHHRMMRLLPWKCFVPRLEMLDQMIKLCDGRDPIPKNFLCFFIPKLDWLSIVGSSRQISANGSQIPGWTPVTCEILCRLLHILLSLGSNPQRLEKNNELEKLFAYVESLPWRCISVDQLDYLCHLACERYSWTSPILYQSIKSHSRDIRYCVFRLLKIVCGLPLTGEEKGTSRTPPLFQPFECLHSDWLKMHFFIKTVGQLLQKIRSDDKTFNKTTSIPLSRFIERSMESIEMTSTYLDATEQLPDLLDVLYNYVNVLSSTLQTIVCDSMRMVLVRKATCQSCSTKQTPTPHCQDCIYMRSRSLSRLTIQSSIKSICNTVSSAFHMCVLLEDAIISYLELTITVQDNVPISEVASNSWKEILSAFHKPIVNKEEFIRHSLQRSCVLSLYIFALGMVDLSDFHSGITFLSQDLPNESRLEKLYEMAVFEIQWLSTIVPTCDIQCKFILIWDHFLCICALLFKVASLSPVQGFTVHSVVDTVASLIPLLEQISQDKVKTGLLGSLGIGTQSPLSIEFRFIVKALLVYLKNWIAKADNSSTISVTNAQDSFEAFKNLSSSNKAYVPYQSSITQICVYISSSEISLELTRNFLALLVQQYFSNLKFLAHFVALG